MKLFNVGQRFRCYAAFSNVEEILQGEYIVNGKIRDNSKLTCLKCLRFTVMRKFARLASGVQVPSNLIALLGKDDRELAEKERIQRRREKGDVDGLNISEVWVSDIKAICRWQPNSSGVRFLKKRRLKDVAQAQSIEINLGVVGCLQPDEH